MHYLCARIVFMCMLFFKTKGSLLPEDRFINRFLRDNPHGVGAVSSGEVKRWLPDECSPSILKEFCSDRASLVHFRLASRGGISARNIHPFEDSRLPGYYFAHNGTLSFTIPDGITDSEWFYKQKLVPAILEHGFEALPTVTDMRTRASRFLLWNGHEDESPYFYGDWYFRDGVYYSRYVEGARLVGMQGFWGTITSSPPLVWC